MPMMIRRAAPASLSAGRRYATCKLNHGMRRHASLGGPGVSVFTDSLGLAGSRRARSHDCGPPGDSDSVGTDSGCRAARGRGGGGRRPGPGPQDLPGFWVSLHLSRQAPLGRRPGLQAGHRNATVPAAAARPDLPARSDRPAGRPPPPAAGIEMRTSQAKI